MAIVAQRSAAFSAGMHLNRGDVRGATSHAGSIDYWNGVVYGETGFNLLVPRYNVEVGAGGCLGYCLEVALGYDNRNYWYAYGADGWGAEAGMAPGCRLDQALALAHRQDIPPKQPYGPIGVSGSVGVDQRGSISGASAGASVGVGLRYGGSASVALRYFLGGDQWFGK